jgi:uncharacterized membrane protein
MQKTMNKRIEPLAKGIGWFSIGLGLAEVAAPGKIAQLIGMGDQPGKRTLLRFYGFREIAAGVGILSGRRTDGWMWGRVAGDVVDIATLGSAMGSEAANRRRLATATAAVLGVTALDVYCGRELTRMASENGRISFKNTIIINRSPQDVYSFWRDLKNIPRFMNRLESVQVMSEKLSHWRAKAPAGVNLEWDSEIIRDEPNSLITWRSVEGSGTSTSGSVRFERATGGRGTLVILEVEYTPPGGVIGAGIAKLFGTESRRQAENGLRRMKQILETGDIVISEGTIHPRTHPARPPAESERGIAGERWRTHEIQAERSRTPVGEEAL